jgi:hypothetical protein
MKRRPFVWTKLPIRRPPETQKPQNVPFGRSVDPPPDPVAHSEPS